MKKRNLVIIPAWIVLCIGAYCYRVDHQNRAYMAEMQAFSLVRDSPKSPFLGDKIISPEAGDVYGSGWRYLPPE